MSVKEETLKNIKKLAQKGELSRQEVTDAYDEGADRHGASKHKFATGLFAGIGGAIVFLGIVILVGQNWDELSEAARIMVTLGGSIATFIAGILVSRTSQVQELQNPLHLIAALLLPVGIATLLETLSVPFDGHAYAATVSLLLLAIYIGCFIALRQSLFLFFTIAAGVGLFWSLTSLLVDNSVIESATFFFYQLLFSGASLIALGYGLTHTPHRVLSGMLYGFGSLGFLAGAMLLGGWEPHQSVAWEVIFPLLAMSVIFMGASLRSKSLIVFGTLYLMLFIIKITIEYFSSGMGWSLALVLAGFLLMGVGYLPVILRRFISRSSS